MTSETINLKKVSLELLDWLKCHDINPDDSVTVCVIVSTLLSKASAKAMADCIQHASEALKDTDAAGSPAAILRSYRKIERERVSEAIKDLVRSKLS